MTKSLYNPKPVYFKDQAALREWFVKNHSSATEIWVGFYKKGTGKENFTWSEAVDQALCFGWIDGIRKSVDELSYCNRFTPRRAGSNWSDINIKKVKALKKAGLMAAAGLKAFEKRKKKKRGTVSKPSLKVAVIKKAKRST